MQRKDSILDQLINDPELKTKDRAKIIKYCVSNISEFKTCIKALINDYYTILLNQKLFDNENTIIELSNNLQLNLAEFSSRLDFEINQFKSKIQELNDRAKSSLTKPIYQPTITQLSTFQKNVTPAFERIVKKSNKQLEYINTHCENMIEQIENLGIINLQKSISSCIDIFLNMDNPESINDYYHDYSDIAKTLAEFWYDGGMQLLAGKDLLLGENTCYPVSANNENKILEGAATVNTSSSEYSKLQFEKNTQVLMFLYLAKPNSCPMIENECYRALFNYPNVSIASSKQFLFNKIAQENYIEFSSVSKHIFDIHKDRQLNLNVIYHNAWISLYQSIAYYEHSKCNHNEDKDLYNKLANQCMNFAKIGMIYSFEKNIIEAENIIIEYNLMTDIEIALSHFKNGNSQKYDASLRVYKRIYQYEFSETAKLDQIYVLFEYWLNEDKYSDLKPLANSFITHSLSKADERAYSILNKLAEKDNQYIEPLIKGVMQSESHKLNIKAYEFLKTRNNHFIAQYLMYVMAKDFFKQIEDAHYESLLAAANDDYEPAISEINRILKDDTTESDKVLTIIIKNLVPVSIFSLSCLDKKYLKLNVGNLPEACLNQLIKVYFNYISKSSDTIKIKNKVINDLKYLVIEKNEQALDVSVNYSKFNVDMMVFLAEYCTAHMSENKTLIDKLKELEKILMLYYTDYRQAEILYCTYLIKRGLHTIADIDLLIQACNNKYEPAQVELFDIYETNRINDNCLNLNFLFLACGHTAHSALVELNRIINSDDYCLNYDVILKSTRYLASLEFKDKTFIQDCINKLHEFATSPGHGRIYSAHSLCLYFTRHKYYVKAGLYFNMCSKINTQNLNVICQKLQSQNCFHDFLIHCSDDVYKNIPHEYRKYTHIRMNIQTDSKNVLSKIRLFEQKIMINHEHNAQKQLDYKK